MKKTALLSLLLLSVPSVAVARIAPVPSAPVPVIERVQTRPQYRPPLLIALGRKQVESRFAADVLSLEITRGIGIVINFGSLGDAVQGVQISDPSTLVYKQMGAGAVFIKPIQKLNFPGNLSATNGRNLLTIVMRSGSIYQFDLAIKSASVNYSGIDIVPDGSLAPPPLPAATLTTASTSPAQQAPQSSPSASTPLVAEVAEPPGPPQVSFFDTKTDQSAEETLAKETSTPKESAISSEPASESKPKAEPQDAVKPSEEEVVSKQQTIPQPQETSRFKYAKEVKPAYIKAATTTTPELPSNPVELSHAIARGLPVALSKRQIGRYSYTYYKSQSAIRALRRGRAKTLKDAARISRTKLSVLTQLVKWGTK